MNLFAQISKIDEEKRLVYGRIAEEAVDKSGEIMDYESSKPHFIRWSEEVAADTEGKSLGNVRAMHGKIAAGKLTAIGFDDAQKGVDVAAKIIDDQEWRKCLEGVYTGFSIGGRYVGEKTVEKINDRDVTRYTAAPNEVSLVDRPCMPGATFFSVQKADGTIAKVDFQHQADPEPQPEPAVDDATVEGTADEVALLGKTMNKLGLTIGQVIEKIAEREDTSPKEGESKYGDVAYADEKNKKYPLDTPEHVGAAASYWGMEKNRSKYSAEDQAAISAKIAAAKKKHGIGDEADKSEKPLSLAKGLATCGALAGLLEQIEYICRTVEHEAEVEGDGSPIGGKLCAWLAEGGQLLKEMVDEEIAEAAAGGEEPDDDDMAMAQRAGELSKVLAATMQKVGARNSKSDQDRIQQVHDHAVGLGADCSAGKAQPAGALDKTAAPVSDELRKLLDDAVAPLKKRIEEQDATIKKLADLPAPARVSLRAVSKGEDVGTQAAAPAAPQPIVDDLGDAHDAAGLIKNLHQAGGIPLAMPLR